MVLTPMLLQFDCVQLSPTPSTTQCLQFDIIEEPQEVIHSTFKSHNRRTTSSLDKVRTWKKYKNKKHLSQLELDRKRDLANKQERRRMHRLNDALNKLR
jgi:hypothetical protein